MLRLYMYIMCTVMTSYLTTAEVELPRFMTIFTLQTCTCTHSTSDQAYRVTHTYMALNTTCLCGIYIGTMFPVPYSMSISQLRPAAQPPGQGSTMDTSSLSTGEDVAQPMSVLMKIKNLSLAVGRAH